MLDNPLEGPRNATKAYEILWDLEEGKHRSSKQPESPPMVVGNVANNPGHRPRSVATFTGEEECRDAFESEI